MHQKVKELLVAIAIETGFVLLGLFRLFSDDATASERNLILYAAIPIVSSLLAFCALAVIYHREDKRRRHYAKHWLPTLTGTSIPEGA